MGNNTPRALRAFQTHNALNPDGDTGEPHSLTRANLKPDPSALRGVQ